jgi:hypothetical protein
MAPCLDTAKRPVLLTPTLQFLHVFKVIQIVCYQIFDKLLWPIFTRNQTDYNFVY